MLTELRRLLGEDRFREGIETRAWTIDGVRPAAVLFPESTAEVVHIVRVAAESDLAIVPANRAGGAAKGNPPRRCDLVVSLTRMNGVLEYEPADLTAAVQAGHSLTELNHLAHSHGQWLPLDPPGAETATLGGIAATDDFGPLRTGFGLMRDYVIGIEAVLADGSIVHSGGRVVKNVAGFDMNKLYLGSYGTLGLITKLNVKLRPEPEFDSTLLIEANALAPLVELGQGIIHSELLPSALEICNREIWTSLFQAGERRPIPNGGQHGLAIRFLEARAAVDYQCTRVAEFTRGRKLEIGRVDGDESGAFWGKWNRLLTPGPGTLSLRLSCLPQRAPRFFQWGEERLGHCASGFGVTLTLAWGITRAIANVALDEATLPSVGAVIANWRAEANAAGGHLTIESASPALKRVVDSWADVGPQRELMDRIKAKFDPKSLFSPGRFLPRL